MYPLSCSCDVTAYNDVMSLKDTNRCFPVMRTKVDIWSSLSCKDEALALMFHLIHFYELVYYSTFRPTVLIISNRYCVHFPLS